MSNMVQFNLLPDIKLQYIKARRTKHLLMSASVIAAIASLSIAVMLFLGVNVFQKKNLTDLSKDITSAGSQLTGVQDLDKILTVQNQLNSLPALHDSKPAASRLFTFLSQTTPVDVSISDVSVDFTTNLITVEGIAPNLLAVNRYVDTLKFTDLKRVDENTVKAFSKVKLAEFGTVDGKATYQVTFAYEPAIFSNQKDATLVVPQTTTTRSSLDKPGEIIQNQPEQIEGQ